MFLITHFLHSRCVAVSAAMIIFSLTFAQQHLRCDVVGCSHQGVSQTALVLPVGSLLQCHQSVTAAAVGHIIPEVTGLHAVLSDMAPWRQKGRNDVVQFHMKHSVTHCLD